MAKFTLIRLINIKYVLAMLATLVFTCLAAGLTIDECGCIFSNECRTINSKYQHMTGLVATSLALFMIATILSIAAIFNGHKWIVFSNFLVILSGAVLMLAALAIFYRDFHFWATLMGGIAMTLSFETAAFLLIEQLASEEIVVVRETLPQ